MTAAAMAAAAAAIAIAIAAAIAIAIATAKWPEQSRRMRFSRRGSHSQAAIRSQVEVLRSGS